MIRSINDPRKIAGIVRKLLGCAAFAILVSIINLTVRDERLCAVAYSVFFACADWLMYYILLFCYEFSGVDLDRLVRREMIRVLLALDTIFVLTNPIWNHTFELQPVYTVYGELCYKPVFHGLMIIHFFLCYLLAIGSAMVLIYKASRSAETYREKYLILLAILGLVLLFDGYYMFTGEAINGSVIGYAISGVMIYYYAVQFVPKELMRRTLTRVVKDIPDAVFVIDEDWECVQKNDEAEAFLEKEGIGMEVMKEWMGQWEEEHGSALTGDYTFPLTREQDGQRVHYNVYCNKLYSERQHYLGCFFIIHDRTEEIESIERERFTASHDELTGLYNRQYFFRRVRETLESNPDGEYMMVCSDVRNFKLINDVYGVNRGDDLLKRIAEELKNRTIEGEIYGRLESDRFALLIKKENFREEVFVAEPQNLLRVEANFAYPIQLCVGVYEIDDKSLSISGMCDRAFMAINTIKGKYGADIAFYDDELRQGVLREQELTSQLNEALATGQFQIYLQPQVNSEGKILGAEALVRWFHPEKGMIPPGEFIDVFERNGLISKLDRYVWELACRQLAKWKELGRDDLYISVNISPKDFYFMDVYQTFVDLTRKYGISTGNLKLEITETAVMSDMAKQMRLIERLQEAGFVVEMDDFGSGYSSLNMLKNIRVDVLKIDMAFLGKTEDEARAQVILRIIVDMSRQLKIPVITEGVETEAQVSFLTNIGCDMFQGYFFARPMEVRSFEEKYMQG